MVKRGASRAYFVLWSITLPWSIDSALDYNPLPRQLYRFPSSPAERDDLAPINICSPTVIR